MAHAGGRPSNYKKEYEEQAYNYCLLGATDKEMAVFFGVAESTFNKWKLDHPEFSESLKRGKVQADSVIASKLFHRAKGFDHPELITASFQGMITDTKTVTKYYPPDTTAGIFWLKNRQPEKWRDQTHVESKIEAKVELIDEAFEKRIMEEAKDWELAVLAEADKVYKAITERIGQRNNK